VKVEESVKEEDIPVKKRIAHEAAQNYPPQVAAPAKQQINPMRVSCILIVLKIWVGSPIHLNRFIVLTFLPERLTWESSFGVRFYHCLVYFYL
jgi:hypothetical protein